MRSASDRVAGAAGAGAYREGAEGLARRRAELCADRARAGLPDPALVRMLVRRRTRAMVGTALATAAAVSYALALAGVGDPVLCLLSTTLVSLAVAPVAWALARRDAGTAPARLDEECDDVARLEAATPDRVLRERCDRWELASVLGPVLAGSLILPLGALLLAGHEGLPLHLREAAIPLGAFALAGVWYARKLRRSLTERLPPGDAVDPFLAALVVALAGAATGTWTSATKGVMLADVGGMLAMLSAIPLYTWASRRLTGERAIIGF